jgi:hypothetical protein
VTRDDLPPDSGVQTNPEVLAGWLTRFRQILEYEGEENPSIVAVFDPKNNFYLQAVPGYCEAVSRAYAPTLTERQEEILRELGWTEPEPPPPTPRQWFRRRPVTLAQNWALTVDGDVTAEACLDICRRTAESVFQQYQPATLEFARS